MLVVKIDPDERAMRMKVDPETYFITEHYRNYPFMLVRLSTVTRDDLPNCSKSRGVGPRRNGCGQPMTRRGES